LEQTTGVTFENQVGDGKFIYLEFLKNGSFLIYKKKYMLKVLETRSIKKEASCQWLMTVILATRKTDPEDHSSRLAQAKSLQDPISTSSWAQ
jgi:hypothetical protein